MQKHFVIKICNHWRQSKVYLKNLSAHCEMQRGKKKRNSLYWQYKTNRPHRKLINVMRMQLFVYPQCSYAQWAGHVVHNHLSEIMEKHYKH